MAIFDDGKRYRRPECSGCKGRSKCFAGTEVISVPSTGTPFCFNKGDPPAEPKDDAQDARKRYRNPCHCPACRPGGPATILARADAKIRYGGTPPVVAEVTPRVCSTDTPAASPRERFADVALGEVRLISGYQRRKESDALQEGAGLGRCEKCGAATDGSLWCEGCHARGAALLEARLKARAFRGGA